MLPYVTLHTHTYSHIYIYFYTHPLITLSFMINFTDIKHIERFLIIFLHVMIIYNSYNCHDNI